VGFVVILTVIVWWPLLVIAPPCVFGVSRWLGRKRSDRRQDELAAVLPDVIDLVFVVVGSGGTVTEALWAVELRGPEVVRPHVSKLLESAKAGRPFRQALADLPDALHTAYRPLVSALLTTERDGAPVSLLLARLGDEARDARRRRAEIRARRLPVQLLFPLAICSLPAVFVGAVVPLVLLSFRSL
jgi:tight adherence protein C